MKKVLFLLVVIFAFSFSVIPSQAIDISLDGQPVQLTEETGFPFIDQANRTQVPFRQTMESFGCTVSWDPINRIAIASKDGVTVQVPIGEAYIVKDGQQIKNDTAALIKDNRTYLPIRAVLEAFGANVTWDNETQTVVVFSSKNSFIVALCDRLADQCEYGEQIEKLNEYEKVIYLCCIFEGEINNGGFDQFFYNSAGDYTKETIDALLEIGATNTVELLKTATTIFPNSIVPQNHEERQVLLDKIQNDEIEKKLSDLDNSFYEYKDDLLNLEYEYVMLHKSEFF